MNRANAEAAINSLFNSYSIPHSAIPTGHSDHVRGKVYELYVLTIVVDYLRNLGFNISFSSSAGTVQFKSSPGLLKAADPHFEVSLPGSPPSFDIYLDVEFQTMGSSKLASHSPQDLSHHHEIDIGVYTHGMDNVHPQHDEVALAVECKAVVSLPKSVIRAILGVRRELSLLDHTQSSLLAQTAGKVGATVPADPPSEVWLASTDIRVLNYQNSPGSFGIECRHEDP
jgi:hypothetical protein